MIARRSTPAARRSVRMTDAQWRLIEAAAAEAETYPSSFVRMAAIAAARREVAQVPSGSMAAMAEK